MSPILIDWLGGISLNFIVTGTNTIHVVLNRDTVGK